MKCPKCQFDNLEGAKFCNECGNKLELSCRKCGKVNPLGSKFCNECGHSLQKSRDGLSVDYEQPQTYTPKHLADKILTSRSSIEGERKIVTVLFADVANYTSISENLDPEEVHQIMDGCFKILMDEIHQYEGTINQFTGDGVMALFGAPVAHEDHAQRACYVALSIQQNIEKYGEKIKKDTGLAFKMRIGINSGPVIVGAIGDDLRMDYTAIGDTTNLGSRMESLANPQSILVSANTHKLVRDFFECNPLGELEVKGKEKPQEAFELIKTSKVETRIEASVAKGLTRFVGRKNSMASLLNAFKTAKSGFGQVVGLVGEAGAGKSRLLLEMRQALPEGENIYLEGRCIHYGSSMPYLPILDVLRTYFGIKGGDREFLIGKIIKEAIIKLDETLERSIPFIKDLLSLKTDDDEYLKLDPKIKRERTFEALRSLMIRLSHEKPLILAIEDLHWIDKTSEEFIDYLIGGLTNNPILLILLYRPEYTHQWGSKSYYSKIGLTQLGISSSGELVKAILEDGEIAPELKQLILNRSAGNPLFMEEFTHTLLENGTIERKDELYLLSKKASKIEIPDTIQGIISARLDRLEDNLKRTMQVASVIGRDFAFRILQTIMGMREELKSYLLNLQGLEFIYEKNLFPELEYIFKHALTQEVAYNSLLLNRRKEIHESIGKAIEVLYPERLEEFYEMLAYHFSKSENVEKAILYLKKSGEKAENNYSHLEAYRFYNDSIDLINKLPETEENKRKKLDILMLMMYPYAYLGFLGEGFWVLTDGEKLSTDLNDKKYLLAFRFNIANYHNHHGNAKLALEYSKSTFEEAFKIKDKDVDLIVQSAWNLCFAYSLMGEYRQLIKLIPKVITLLEEKKREHDDFNIKMIHPYTLFSTYCGLSLEGLGYFEKGKKYLDKACHVSNSINHSGSSMTSEIGYGVLLCEQGCWKESIDHLRKAIRYSEELDYLWVSGLLKTYLGYSYSMLGDYETGIKYATEGLEISRDCGVEVYLAQGNHMSGSAFIESGELADAKIILKEGLKLSKKNNEKSIEARTLISLGNVYMKLQPLKMDKSEEYLFFGMDLAKKLYLKPDISKAHLILGELYLNIGNKTEAMLNFTKAHNMFKEMNMGNWLERTQNLIESF